MLWAALKTSVRIFEGMAITLHHILEAVHIYSYNFGQFAVGNSTETGRNPEESKEPSSQGPQRIHQVKQYW
jgi:hypothetical protein